MANFRQIEAHERTERFKTFENLLSYFTPYKKAFGILFFIMLIATGLQALLPFISKAHQIIVLKAGMIAEVGNHQSLMENKKYYYELIQSQDDTITN